jgi:hypothetical protein
VSTDASATRCQPPLHPGADDRSTGLPCCKGERIFMEVACQVREGTDDDTKQQTEAPAVKEGSSMTEDDSASTTGGQRLEDEKVEEKST